MPVWVTVGHQPVRSGKDAQFFIDWLARTLATAMGMQTSPEERQARALAERSLGVPPSSPPHWNNEWEKEEVRRLYAEPRARLIQRRDESQGRAREGR